MEYWMAGLTVAVVANLIYTGLVHFFLGCAEDVNEQRFDNLRLSPELQEEIDRLEEFGGPATRFVVQRYWEDGRLHIYDTEGKRYYDRESFRSRILCKYLTEEEI